MKTFNQNNKSMENKRDYDFVNNVFAEWMLPGEWKTMEVRTDVNHQETSYAMATKLHPNSKDYVDFWGNVNPYGEGCNLIFCTINELSPAPTFGRKGKHRFSATTGRFTSTGMSTKLFEELDDAVKHVVTEMVKTTKMYDKIHKRKTKIWSDQALALNHDITTDAVQ
jgi:hypothetical protein